MITQKGRAPFLRDQLVLDPKNGDVVRAELFSDQSAGRKARVWARYLHTGQAWGLIGQAVMGISALGAVVLVYTGFALSWRRFFRAK